MLLCFGDNGLRDSKPTRNKEHPLATVLNVNRNELRLAESYRTKVSHVCAWTQPAPRVPAYRLPAADGSSPRFQGWDGWLT